MPENTGYYKKYTVIDNRTGCEVDERTWTLIIDRDPFARPALQAYRDAAAADGQYAELVSGLDALLAELT